MSAPRQRSAARSRLAGFCVCWSDVAQASGTRASGPCTVCVRPCARAAPAEAAPRAAQPLYCPRRLTPFPGAPPAQQFRPSLFVPSLLSSLLLARSVSMSRRERGQAPRLPAPFCSVRTPRLLAQPPHSRHLLKKALDGCSDEGHRPQPQTFFLLSLLSRCCLTFRLESADVLPCPCI